MEQFHEIVRILGQIRQHGMNMDDSIAIASIIDKLPPSWKMVHRALMQRKEELTMEQLGSHLYVEEGIRQKESKNKGGARVTGASGSTINFVDEGKPYGNRKGRGKPGKATKSSKFKKNGKGKGKTSVKCWVCNGPHFKKDCEVWKKRKAQMEGKSSDNHGQMAKEDEVPPCGPKCGICAEHPESQWNKRMRRLKLPVAGSSGENDDLACRGHILNGNMAMNMDDSIAICQYHRQVATFMENGIHRALMQRKEELTMEQLGSPPGKPYGKTAKER
nr:zinc finger, CCHC-type [Ipomoea batatas]